MQKFLQLFGRLKSIVLGMVHVRALPGTPCATLPLAQIIEAACGEAEMYRAAGVFLFSSKKHLQFSEDEELKMLPA